MSIQTKLLSSSKFGVLVDGPIIELVPTKESFGALQPGVLCEIGDLNIDREEGDFSFVTEVHLFDLAVELFSNFRIGFEWGIEM